MTVRLKTYKRKPSPSLQSSQLKDQSMVITNYLANELQELENVLVIQEQADGEKTQTLIALNTAVDGNTASITSEATTRSTADTALASLVTTLTATVTTGDSTNAAAITTEATARADADSAEATARETVAASVVTESEARVAADGTLATDITTVASSVTTEATARATADTAEATARELVAASVATEVSDRETAITAVEASVTAEATARAAADTAEATARETVAASLTTEVSDREAAITTVAASVTTEATARAAADNTLLAKYGVTLNSNGYVTGFSQNNDGTTGTFKILADKFTIVDPSDSAGEAGTQVFDITGGVVTINGSLVVNGSLNVAGKASSGSVGAISGTAGNDVTMTSYSEISQTNFVNAAPQHIAAANHSDGSVSAGDVMGGTPLYSFNFTTYAFSGTKDFIISTLLDPIGSYGSASSTGFAFAMKATTSATDYASTSASAYVSTKGTSKGGTLSSQNYMLSDVVSLSGSTQYYIWVFGVMDDVNTSGGQRGIRDGQITVAGLNI